MLLLGGSAYAYAFLFTGNPILPLANALFESTYFPLSNLSNPRYTLPLDAANVWALLFDSGSFYESRDGVSGFHWLVLLVPAAVATRLRPRLAALIVIGLDTAALLYSSQSYLRYLMPAMLLMIPACAAGASLLQVRWGTALTIMLVSLNLTYQSNANWILREGGVYRMFASLGKDQSLRDRVAPELRLIELAKLQQTDARILVTSRARPYVAASAGQAFTTSWYDTELWLAFGDGGNTKLTPLLEHYHFTHVLVHPDGSGTDVLPLLTGLEAELVGSNGAATLWRLPERQDPGQDLLLDRDRSAIAVLREARQRYRQWHRDRRLRHPERYPEAAISTQ